MEKEMIRKIGERILKNIKAINLANGCSVKLNYSFKGMCQMLQAMELNYNIVWNSDGVTMDGIEIEGEAFTVYRKRISTK